MSDDGSWWKVDIFLAAFSSVTPSQQAWRRQMFTMWFPRYLICYRPFKNMLLANVCLFYAHSNTILFFGLRYLYLYLFQFLQKCHLFMFNFPYLFLKVKLRPSCAKQVFPFTINKSPPCIMCVQYRGGCSVPWGVFSTVGDIMSTVGGYLEYCGGVQYRGGYHDKCGGISWVPWGCSVPWGISWVPWGVILSTVEGVQYRGGIPSFEIWVLWGDIMMHVGDIMSTVGGVQYRGVLK